tara:strand:+ start:364 stop:687 length:324 start_codon:yes stop_codon:yes gene_type:complete
MANLKTKIELYLKANSKTWDNTKVELQDDSDDKGVYIKTWNYDIPKPSKTKLNSYQTAGNKVENNLTVISTRKKLYGSWQDQLDEIFTDIDAWKTRITKIKTDNPKD